MNAIKFLRQAHKADQLGYYKLADKFYNQAYRFAAGERAIEEAVIKALEEAGIKSGEAIATDAIVAAVDKAIAEAVVAGGDKSTLEALLREAGSTEEEIVSIMDKVATEGAAALEKEVLVTSLSESLNGPLGIARRMKIGVPPTKPSFMDKTKEQFGNFNQKLQGYMKDPKIVKRLKGAGIIIVSIGAAALGGPPLFKAIHERTGKTATDQDVEDAANGNDIDPYKNMYEDRMQAGQQQRQNEAAQKFVDENKSKYTSQRAFYDAALAAGDKNFANDVIAIVKKDMNSLVVEPTK
jgi:hypothetical protein